MAVVTVTKIMETMAAMEMNKKKETGSPEKFTFLEKLLILTKRRLTKEKDMGTMVMRRVSKSTMEREGERERERERGEEAMGSIAAMEEEDMDTREGRGKDSVRIIRGSIMERREEKGRDGGRNIRESIAMKEGRERERHTRERRMVGLRKMEQLEILLNQQVNLEEGREREDLTMRQHMKD